MMPDKQEIDRLVALYMQGRYQEAETAARSLTARYPAHPFGWSTLGVILQQTGRNGEALLLMQKAAELSPNDAQLHNNLGSTLSSLGLHAEAEAAFRRALKLNKNFAEAHLNLGATLHDLERFDEALSCYRKAVMLKPDLADAHYNTGNTLKRTGRLEEAAASYRKALQLNPASQGAANNLGLVLQATGKLTEAETVLRDALRTHPDSTDLHNNLGRVLHDLGRREEARQAYETGLRIRCDHPELLNNLGNTLHELGRLAEAEAAYRKALAIDPDFEQALNNLGNTLQDMGRLDEAVTCYRQALKKSPYHFNARSNLLFGMNYSLHSTPQECLAEAREYGHYASKKAAAPYTKWAATKDPERLRIGLVSADLRNHPVGYFLENVLAQLASRKLELIAYPVSPQNDELTARIKPFFVSWKPIYGKEDQSAARLIHDDKLHILIDLSGHTRHTRLPMFAWKPAPIQVAWLGYFATTGVAEIDYILGDPFVSPHTEAAHFTEKIWQLPECYWCFSPPDVRVDVSSLPALTAKHITFGCFNNLAKMNDAVVALWAKILHAVPGARLFLKYSQLDDPAIRAATLARYATHGITADRLVLEGFSSRADYLASYHRVDIALDPFPYPGGTTTMESLWMGVPVLTKRGDRFLSHAGETIACNAGLSEWVAADENEYLAKAVAFASDPERLLQLRAGLRQQVLASPLFDAARFAAHFETAMRGMWAQRNKPTA